MQDVDPKLNWVVSFPKSGNTWIRLCSQAYYTGEPTIDGQAKLGDVGAQVWHDISPMPARDLPLVAEPQIRPAAMFNLALMKEDERPIKSHHGNFSINGQKLWRDVWTDAVVNPVRDPRDVCCSLKHHMGHESYMQSARFMDQDGAQIDDDDSMTHFIGSWSMHVQSWLDSDLDVLTVRYEDLWDQVYRQDSTEGFRRIFEHLGVDVNEERLEMAVEEAKFDKLKEREQQEGFPEASDNQNRFFRKGETGGWKQELPEEVAEKIVEDHADMMDKLGYL